MLPPNLGTSCLRVLWIPEVDRESFTFKLKGKMLKIRACQRVNENVFEDLDEFKEEMLGCRR